MDTFKTLQELYDKIEDIILYNKKAGLDLKLVEELEEIYNKLNEGC